MSAWRNTYGVLSLYMWFRIWEKFGIDHAGSLCLDQGFLNLLCHGPLWKYGETYGPSLTALRKVHLTDLSPSVSSASARTSQRTGSVSIMRLSPSFFGLSSYLTGNAIYLSCASVVKCFFGLSSYLTENTVCLSYASVVKCFFGLSSYLTENTVCPNYASVVGCFFGRSS